MPQFDTTPENDIEMLQEVGLGVCVGTGRELAKQAAKKVSAYSNNDHAIAREVCELVFNNPQGCSVCSSTTTTTAQ